MTEKLTAPFTYFGGKRRVADVVWRAFGNTPNYVEPFAGSLAVLLARPHAPKYETVNDADCYLANFWRATQAAPAEVAKWADWPVNEADLHARHLSLVRETDFRERMKTEPEYFDARIAGWWVWGAGAWLGDGWCKAAYREGATPGRAVPREGQGIHPIRLATPDGKALVDRMLALSARLRGVRVFCGDWTRIVKPSVVSHRDRGQCTVFLDPPYDDGDMEYAVGNQGGLSAAVRDWAIANGDDANLRIALCGYEGEHAMPGTWRVHAWKARGGYGSMGNGEARKNSRRERIWFSPHCLPIEANQSLFDRFENDNNEEGAA